MISADHMCLYREGVPFYPFVLDEKVPLDQAADAAFVLLPCRKDSDLNWNDAIARAHACQASGKLILWYFDFGLEELSSLWDGETTFLSYTVAIDAFVQEIWPRFNKQTLGVCVYRGKVGLMRFDPLDFNRWATDLHIEAPSPLHQQLFTCEILSQLLHRLISFFPESALPIACIDMECCLSPALQALMVAKLRLEHLSLFLKGARIPLSRFHWEESGGLSSVKDEEPQVAVCIPENFNCHALLDALFTYLQMNHAKFRMISEARLTEEWNGINTLIAISDLMSPLGKRKLKGFEAAGGEVISWVKKKS